MTVRPEEFSRSGLAELAREYMLTAQVNDRTGSAAVTGSRDDMETILWLHPMFQPTEYQPIDLQRQGDVLTLRLLDGPARADHDAVSWSSLWRSGRAKGLLSAAQAINRSAKVTRIDHSAVPSWTISIDAGADPARVPDWAAIGHLSNSSTFGFEQRASITRRSSNRAARPEQSR